MKLPIGPLAAIGAAVGTVAIAFSYTAGWLSPQRLTPDKLVMAVQPPTGPALGHRRNHARGVCFTGTFEANGEAASLSKASVLARGQVPVVGRFNIGGGDPHTPEAMAQVRGLGLRFTPPDGQEWRMAMIDAPVFAAPTPAAFYEFLTAGADPAAFARYSATHPEILTFIGWAKGHERTESWTEDRFNSLDSFMFVDAQGERHAVRWSIVPQAPAVSLSAEALAQRAPDFLETDLALRVSKAPARFSLVVTVANAGDPTSDPTKPWPTDRRTVDAGTLVVEQIVPEVDGPCRDLTFDPAVLPAGITTSDDPFPAARSAAYRVSHDRRLDESAHYPHEGSR